MIILQNKYKLGNVYLFNMPPKKDGPMTWPILDSKFVKRGLKNGFVRASTS